MAASKPPQFHAAHNEYMTSAGSPPISPQGHPSTATNLTTTANSSISSGSDGASPTDDRRSSSIQSLRLKAREHELRLEMLRQNGHAPDILSWTPWYQQWIDFFNWFYFEWTQSSENHRIHLNSQCDLASQIDWRSKSNRNYFSFILNSANGNAFIWNSFSKKCEKQH